MKIFHKETLAEIQDTKITRLDILAPVIAAKTRPGQFIALMVSLEGERIPLTVVDRDETRGTITLIFQEVGLTTRLLGRLNVGNSLYALVGPLGHPTEIKKYGKVILIGGGVGIAEIYPVARAFKEAENHITTIIGVRTKGLLFLEEELKGIACEFYVTTDDGSYARGGFTTDVLTDLLKKDAYDLVYAVGPIPMMQKVSLLTKEFKVKTIVSLNTLMVDATGMCGCCRVSAAGKTKFSCVDGPEFAAHDIDWDELIKRNRIYQDKERYICNLYRL